MTIDPNRLLKRPVSRRHAIARTSAAAGSLLAVAALATQTSAQGTPTPGQGTPLPPDAGDPMGHVTPARVVAAIARLPELAESVMTQTGLPGLAVAVVYNYEVQFAEGYGVREVGKADPINPDTVFQLASVSKSLAAATVAAVLGENGLSWNSRMADLTPDFALMEPWVTSQVTLTDLFSHRSGLPDHAGDSLEDMGYPQAEIIHRLRYYTPEYSFRAGYKYTNFGLTSAALAAAAAVGMDWAEMADERLYAPLGMTSTSSRFVDFLDRSDRATPHIQQDGKWIVTPQQRDPEAQTPAGGVSSSINDLTRWARMILANGMFDGVQVIPAASLRPVFLPHSVSTPAANPLLERDSFYGLGTGVSYTDFGTPQWSHSGAFALGAGTAYYMLPAAGFGIIALGNGAAVGAPEIICLQMLDLVQRGEISRDWPALVLPGFAAIMAPQYGQEIPAEAPADPIPAMPLSTYAGTYSNDIYGKVTISVTNDALTMAVGPAPLTFSLTHLDRDTFVWLPGNENGPVPSALSFTIGADATAVNFTDDYFTWGTNGHGLFTRQAAPAA